MVRSALPSFGASKMLRVGNSGIWGPVTVGQNGAKHSLPAGLSRQNGATSANLRVRNSGILGPVTLGQIFEFWTKS